MNFGVPICLHIDSWAAIKVSMLLCRYSRLGRPRVINANSPHRFSPSYQSKNMCKSSNVMMSRDCASLEAFLCRNIRTAVSSPPSFPYIAISASDLRQSPQRNTVKYPAPILCPTRLAFEKTSDSETDVNLSGLPHIRAITYCERPPNQSLSSPHITSPSLSPPPL